MHNTLVNFCAANLNNIRLFKCYYNILTEETGGCCKFAFMKFRTLLLSAVAACSLFQLTSCEKKEQPIVLPPKGEAQPGRVNMGEQYDNQVFYDFETNSVVQTSANASWDLSFEAGREGYHVWMNGGMSVFILNTHNTDFAGTTALPAGTKTESWGYDDPGGLPDSTAVGKWKNMDGTSKNEVYIVKLNDNDFRKMTLLSVDDTKYTVKVARLNEKEGQTITLQKDDDYNFIYYSFATGVVKPEPPKKTWDVVFTRYRYIYRDMDNYLYYLNGVLLNPYNTVAAADSISSFSSITTSTAVAAPKTTIRDVVGFDWKVYNFSTSRYEIVAKKNYIIQTRNGQIYKFRFLDFYSPSGIKGSPSFESVRLQ